jgi:hypothetical protein
MEIVFAEQKAGDELGNYWDNFEYLWIFTPYLSFYHLLLLLIGLNDDVLATAHALIGDDTLYIEILETLQLNNRQNLPWGTVIMRIQHIIKEKKPKVWPMLRRFLDEVHSGRGK